MVRRAVAVLVVLVLVAGCGSGTKGASEPQASIPLYVEHLGSAVAGAFVPVTVEGHRYAFRVDSGAGRTVIDLGVAGTLGLPTGGPPITAYSLGCALPTEQRRIEGWSVGGRALPAQVVAAQTLAESRYEVHGLQVAGLLGADVLAGFGVVHLDFRSQALGLGGTPPARAPAVPLTVAHVHGAVLLTAMLSLATSGMTTVVVVDTGSTSSYLVTSAAASLGLQPGGPPVTIGTVDCTVQARKAAVRGARLGSVPLTLSRVDVGPSQIAEHDPETGGGLIGDDALAVAGSLWIDLAHQRLVLG